jgi:hypothetical protein
MTGTGFIARTSDARGNPRITTSVHATREDAARAALAADPKARSVTTSIARNGRDTHSDVRSHTRWSLTPQPEKQETTNG